MIGEHGFAIEFVIFESRKDVNMEVPHILIARRFVMLASRDTTAFECRLHRERRVSNRSMDRTAKFVRQNIDIFVVFDGNHEGGTGIRRLPPWVHLHHDVIVGMENLNREDSASRRDVCAERADVPFRLVVPIRRICSHHVVRVSMFGPSSQLCRELPNLDTRQSETGQGRPDQCRQWVVAHLPRRASDTKLRQVFKRQDFVPDR